MVSSHISNPYDNYLKKIKNCYSFWLTNVLCGSFLCSIMHSRVYESKFAKSYSEGL